MTNLTQMRRFNFAFLFASIFLISACASSSKAPSEQSADAKFFQAPDGRGTVYLYRTGRAVGAGGQLNVEVNGITAGGTGPGTFFRWDLKSGSYTFHSSTKESSATVQLDVKAGVVYFLRQDARLGVGNGRVTLKEVDSSQGKNDIGSLELLISAYVPE